MQNLSPAGSDEQMPELHEPRPQRPKLPQVEFEVVQLLLAQMPFVQTPDAHFKL